MNQEELELDVAQVGRILHFVVAKGERVACRPALVVEDWPGQGKPGYVNLVVFPDGSNDGVYGTDSHNHFIGKEHSPDTTAMPRSKSLLTVWETSVLPNHAVRAARTWHWPRECSGMSVPLAPFKDEKGDLYHHNHGPDIVDIQNCYGCLMAAKTHIPR